MNPKRTIIVIPTYNEAKNVPLIHGLIRKHCAGIDVDVLFVDSASPDRTADCVREHQVQDPNLFLLEQSGKLGLGKAYLDGMAWSLTRSYDCLITMDADLSHHPRYLPGILQESKHSDLVIGSRYTKGGGLEDWPKYRLFLSRFANGYARTLTGLPFLDLTSGFQCFRMTLLRKLLRYNIHTEGYAFLVELKFLSILQQASFKELPIIFTDRTHGSTKISKRVIFESMMFVLKLSLQRARVLKCLREKSTVTV